jgi:hypothetical protein
LLGRAGHRDIAVDRSFDACSDDACSKRVWVDEDDEVELQALRVFRAQRPDAGRRLERVILNAVSVNDTGDPSAWLASQVSRIEPRSDVDPWTTGTPLLRSGCSAPADVDVFIPGHGPSAEPI